MKTLIDALVRYFGEANHGFYNDWTVGYCRNCDEIVFVTGTSYTRNAGNDCLGAHYETAYGGPRQCRNCHSTKYIDFESLVVDNNLEVIDSVKILDKTLKKLRGDPMSFFSLYDKDSVLEKEIDKWLKLDEGNKCLKVGKLRKLKKDINFLKEKEDEYCFSNWS